MHKLKRLVGIRKAQLMKMSPTINLLSLITGVDRQEIYRIVRRLEKAGKVTKVRKGIYITTTTKIDGVKVVDKEIDKILEALKNQYQGVTQTDRIVKKAVKIRIVEEEEKRIIQGLVQGLPIILEITNGDVIRAVKLAFQGISKKYRDSPRVLKALVQYAQKFTSDPKKKQEIAETVQRLSGVQLTKQKEGEKSPSK